MIIINIKDIKPEPKVPGKESLNINIINMANCNGERAFKAKTEAPVFVEIEE